MKYHIELEGFEGQNIEVKLPSFFSGAKLFVNGEPAPKGPKRGQMILRRNDGTDIIAIWKPNVLGFDIPSLIVGDEVIHVVDPLKWHELVWSGLPLLLVLRGGALGAIAGVIAFNANMKVFRSDRNTAVKYLLTAGISILAVIVYLVAAILLFSLIGN